MISGQGPTESPSFRLPEPGPDSIEYPTAQQALGYKLGSYINVYNFDAVISKMLGCDDWAFCQKPITREVWDCGCLVEEIIGYEDILLIENPDENNIPKNVTVLLQKGMLKGTEEPESPNDTNYHYHYAPTGVEEDKSRGWWISDELKTILESDYDWKFYEDVVLESEISYPHENGDQWVGGVEKTILDAEFHDLTLAIDDDIRLGGSPDTRARGDQSDILALFSYSALEEGLNALGGAIAALEGDCEVGYSSRITWEAVISSNPDAFVDFYTIRALKEPDSDFVEVGTVQSGETLEIIDLYDETYDEFVGIPLYPRYFISWTATDGSQSPEAEVSKIPNGFVTYGIPICGGAQVNLTGTTPIFPDDCFSDIQDTVSLDWNIALPENSYIQEIRVVKTRGDAVDTIVLESDVRTYDDTEATYSDVLTNDIEYTVEVDVFSSINNELSQTITSDVVTHTVSSCNCDDVDVEVCVDKCWVKKVTTQEEDSSGNTVETVDYPAKLILWLEDYTEDPFSNDQSGNPDPSAKFKIKYCIKNPCAEGIEDFSVRLKMPNKMSIKDISSEFGSVVAYADFKQGQTDGQWILEPEDVEGTTGEDGEPAPDGEPDNWVCNKIRGTLCEVTVDKPIGNERISFIIKDDLEIGVDGTSVEVKDQGVYSTTEYNWDNNYQNKSNSQDDWQSGPPLSVCTNELDMGYGDYLFDLNVVDMDTFDVNVCLSRDGFDTFFLVVINTDFKTEVKAVDPIVGRAINAGWEVSFRNILPGMSLIMGHGDTPIYSSGYETLLRAELTDAAIKLNQDNETCVCIFPFFFKLGGLFETVKNATTGYAKTSTQNVAQGGGNYQLATAAYTGVTPVGPLIFPVADTPVASYITQTPEQTNNNVLIAGMNNIAENIDPRFKDLVNCLKDAYIKVLEKLNNPATSSQYSEEDVYKIVLLVQLFLTMISIFSTISVAKNSEINQILDGIEDLQESLCNNTLESFVSDITEEGGDANTHLQVEIKYCIPSDDVSGIQFHLDIPAGYALDTLSDTDRLGGDAKERKFIQCLTPNGKYLCVYGADLGSRPTGSSNKYLSTGRGQECTSPPTLTRFRLLWNGEEAPPTEMPNVDFVVGSVKMVSNFVLTESKNPNWNGDWYDADLENKVNARDFLVACILCTGFKENLDNPDSYITLPFRDEVSGAELNIAQQYFGGVDPVLSSITYDTEGTNAWQGITSDNVYENKFPQFDANGDGVADIVDVVALRNLFVRLQKTDFDRSETSRAGEIIPKEVCTLGDELNFEFYIPDECSNFCIKPKCNSSVWVSDVIFNSDAEGNPKDVLLEISYSVDCIDDTADIEQSSRLSGIQFKIGGLGGDGIVATLNGKSGSDQDTGTVIANYGWQEHILTSNRGSSVKDTIIAYATSDSGYVPSGKGVLTYVRVNPSSIAGFTAQLELEKQYVFTNGYKIKNYGAEHEKISEFVGLKPNHPMASLEATVKKSTSMVALQKFGLSVVSHVSTTNDVANPPSNQQYDIDTVTANKVVNLISKKTYNELADVEENNKLNIVDVQSAYHIRNIDSFSDLSETSFVPSVCCVCEEPGEFKLATADHTNSLVLERISGWNADVTLSTDSFQCDQNFEGGVILAWTNSELAKYYIVFRKRAGTDERPVPVIGSLVGVVNSSKDFIGTRNTTSEAINKYPQQLGSSTIWVDFPPTSSNGCCPELGQSSEFEYYVVAVNPCGTSYSNKATASVLCCDVAPEAFPSLLVVEGNFDYSDKKSYLSEFKVEQRGKAFTFVDSNSKETRTENGGRVIVSGGSPETGVPNDFRFEYTPPANFIGKDSFKYFVFSHTADRKDWRDWCYDEGEVNVIVYPANPLARGYSGDCNDSDERGGAIITWEPVAGVSFYRIYRNDNLVKEVGPDTTKFFDLPPFADDFQESCEDGVAVQYSVTSVYRINDQELEGKKENNVFEVFIECCDEIPDVDFSLNTDSSFCSESGDRKKKGRVRLKWKDVGSFDEYKIYRRGPYTDIDTPEGDWMLVGVVSEEPDLAGFHKFIDIVGGCEGCGINAYDYYISISTVSGEGDEPTNVKQFSFKCCEVAPIAKDQEFIVERGKRLVDKQLLAFDADANIVKYEIVSNPDEETGYVYQVDEENGTFSFQPNLSYSGFSKFKWKVTDSCGNSAEAEVILWIEGQEVCNEDNYVICNATIDYLTNQQDKDGARKKDDDLPQVPFSLNNKGVPSLRKRCGAYSVAQSIDPSLFGLPQEGCGILTINTPSGSELIIPSISFSCIDEIQFSVCKPYVNDGGTTPSSVQLECVNSIIFADCKPNGGSVVGSVYLECEEPTDFSSGCSVDGNSDPSNVEMTCGEEVEFSVCDSTGGDSDPSNVEMNCGEEVEFSACDSSSE